MSSERIYAATKWSDGPITPSDTARLEPTPVALMALVAGNISATDEEGNTAVFYAVAGATLNIQPVKVNATGTTATGIVALYNV